MRLNESITISAAPQLVWDHVTDPAKTLDYMSGVTRWEVASDSRRDRGLGARYRMLVRVGATELGGLVEVVEFTEPSDMAWSSVTGIDQRGRWRLRELEDGRTRTELRFAYGVAGGGIAGMLSERLSAPSLSRHLRATLHQLKRQVEHQKLRDDAAASRREPVA